MPNLIEKILNALPVKIEVPFTVEFIFTEINKISESKESESPFKTYNFLNNLFHFAAISVIDENEIISISDEKKTTKLESFKKACVTNFFISELIQKNKYSLSPANLLYIFENEKILYFILTTIEKIKISKIKEKKAKKFIDIEKKGFISNLISSFDSEKKTEKLDKIIEIYEEIKSEAIQESKNLKFIIQSDPVNSINGCIEEKINPSIILQLILLKIKEKNLNAEKILLILINYEKKFELVNFLIKLKVININSINEDNDTLIHLGFNIKNFNFIKFILNLNLNIDINQINLKGVNAGLGCLIYSIEENDVDFFDLLVEKKATINSADSKNNTLLHAAVFNGDYKIINKILLIDKNQLFAKNNSNKSPLDLYLTKEKIDIAIFKLLLDFVNVKIESQKVYLKEVIINFLKNPGPLINKKNILLLLLEKLSDNKFISMKNENLCKFSIRSETPIEIIEELINQYKIFDRNWHIFLYDFLPYAASFNDQKKFNLFLLHLKKYYSKNCTIERILKPLTDIVIQFKEKKENEFGHEIIECVEKILKGIKKDLEHHYDNSDTIPLMSLVSLVRAQSSWIEKCLEKKSTINSILTSHQDLISKCDEIPGVLQKEKYEKIKFLSLFVGILLLLAVGICLLLFIPSVSSSLGITAFLYASQYLPEIASGIIALGIATTNYLNQNRFFSAPVTKYNMRIFTEINKKIKKETTAERAVIVVEKLIPLES